MEFNWNYFFLLAKLLWSCLTQMWNYETQSEKKKSTKWAGKKKTKKQTALKIQIPISDQKGITIIQKPYAVHIHKYYNILHFTYLFIHFLSIFFFFTVSSPKKCNDDFIWLRLSWQMWEEKKNMIII